jgi:L-arabonate dehydrase
LSSEIPLIANLQPSGKYFMEDLYYAGGLQVVIKHLDHLLHRECITVNGKTIRENYASAACYNADVISTTESPFNSLTGLAILSGNLCENGAVIKPSAASADLMQHTGKAVVFDSIEDYHARIDSDELDVDESSILVLKNVGPKGYPGMPEVGNMSLPKKLIQKGVKDMVRVSDGRMSGTGFGTVVLHVSPEAATGNNFAVIRTGDVITLDVPNRSINAAVSDQEFEARKAQFIPPEPSADRGYVSLYIDHVQQAHLGADMDFLRGKSGSRIVRDSH